VARIRASLPGGAKNTNELVAPQKQYWSRGLAQDADGDGEV
jgi:hypothetical protein